MISSQTARGAGLVTRAAQSGPRTSHVRVLDAGAAAIGEYGPSMSTPAEVIADSPRRRRRAGAGN